MFKIQALLRATRSCSCIRTNVQAAPLGRGGSLKGFTRVHLAAGEKRTVSFDAASRRPRILESADEAVGRRAWTLRSMDGRRLDCRRACNLLCRSVMARVARELRSLGRAHSGRGVLLNLRAGCHRSAAFFSVLLVCFRHRQTLSMIDDENVRNSLMRLVRFIVLTTFFACCLPSTRMQAQFVHTQGKEIVDGAGKPLLLRGINLGTGWCPKGICGT